jgi:prepilin peptidase dependent protein B
MRNRLFGARCLRGFTLIELMIALAVGLIIVFAIVAMFVTMLRSTSDNLKFVRLNQDLRSVMTLITRDIRRSGANQTAAAAMATDPPVNPFAGITIWSAEPGDPGTCILFSYNSGEATELYGFRWNAVAGSVEERGTSGAACDAVGGWQALSDPALLEITGLSFTEDPLRSPLTAGGATIREITVTLAGALRNDPEVTRELSETIRIRNEEF